jgi:PAS domain S-box-containing protein
MDDSIQAASDAYRLAYESALAGIAIADLQGKLRKVNPAFVEMWGYDDENDVLGRSVTEFWDEPDEAAAVAAAVIERGEWEGELLAEAKGGSTFYVRVTGSVVTDANDDPIYIMSSFVDISEQIARERELARKNEELEQFASVVSHDLRNPLGVAKGRLELAQEDCECEHHSAISTALDRIERIVEDVLWLAREGRDIGSTERVDLTEAIDAAWRMVVDDSLEAELIVEGRLNSIEADYDRLCQLLENIFRNAVEHGGEEVVVTVGKLDDGFYIEDDGPGIPENKRDEVFDAGVSTSEEGTGFGLSIVRKIVEAHGWEIRVMEGTDGGARFEITGVEFVAE